jgi:hypothetical protein
VTESETQLLDDWILHAQTFWAAAEVAELSRREPAATLDFILEVLKRNPQPRVLANLAAGPLEDLLVYHGPAVIERVEALAAEDTVFSQLLSGVWRNAIPRGCMATHPSDAAECLTSRGRPPNPQMQRPGRGGPTLPAGTSLQRPSNGYGDRCGHEADRLQLSC